MGITLHELIKEELPSAGMTVAESYFLDILSDVDEMLDLIRGIAEAHGYGAILDILDGEVN